MEDETRVLSQRGVFTAFDTRRGGHHRVGAELPRFLASKALAPHITGELRVGANNAGFVHPAEWPCRTWLPCYATSRHLRRHPIGPISRGPIPPTTRTR